MKKTSIKTNYLFNTFYQILAIITPFITTPYVSRVLNADGVGVYGYTTSIMTFFVLVATMGTTVYGQRAISQCRDSLEKRSRTFWEIESVSVITSLACLLAWWGYLLVVNQYRLYFLILSVELLSVMADISWFYQGLELFRSITIRNSFVKIVSVLLIFVLVNEKGDLWVYFLIMVLGKLLGNLSMWIILPQHIRFVRIGLHAVLPHVRESIIYFIPAAAASIYSVLDKVMIYQITGSEYQSGYYEQAGKAINMAYVLLASINTVMSARISYLFALEKTEEIKEKLEKTIAFIMTIGVPMSFGIASVAKGFVPWFFGPGYDEVIQLLVLKSPLVVILTIHNYLAALYLVPSGQRARSTKGVLAGAVINLVLNSILIPAFGTRGAVVATIIAECTICIIYFHMSREFINPSILVRYLPKQIIAGVTASIVVLNIPFLEDGLILTTFIQGMVGAIVYVTVLILLRERTMRYYLESVLKRNAH